MDAGEYQDNLAGGGGEDIALHRTVITVLGTGGAGNNTVDRLVQMGAEGIQTIAVNTDAQDLLATHVDRKVLIGKNLTGGLGAGGDPGMGESSAEESKEALATVIEDTEMLFLTCGLGGGTGTGSAPVIGNLARERGVLTVAFVTLPFSEEGLIRWENAQVGLQKLQEAVDTVIVLKNDKLAELFPDLPMAEAFQAGDEILANALRGLSDMVLKKGLINLDFSDVSMVMREGRHAIIGVGESNSDNRTEDAVRRAVTHPMMEADISGAQSALVHVTGGSDMTLKEARQVLIHVAEKLDASARIVWGVTIDRGLTQTIRVMLIVSGLREREEKSEDRVAEGVDFGTIYDEETHFPISKDKQTVDSGSSIFDIKESILASGSEVSIRTKPAKPVTPATQVFYDIFEEEAKGDLERFDRAIHLLRENPENRKALLDARQACKLLQASTQMFGFDEMGQLLSSVEALLTAVQSRELQLTPGIIDSVTLAMEMVVDLAEKRSDGRGETGYIVDRLQELREGKFEPSDSTDERGER